jgi:uncharacterized membrane protein
MRRIPSIILSQALVVLYALALTFLPGELYWIVMTLFFITYMGVIMAINIRRIRASTTSEDAQYVRSGRQIIKMEPQKAMEIMQTDPGIGVEMREQIRVSMLPLVSLPIVFGAYYLYLHYASPIYRQSGDATVIFLGNLAMFEIFFLIPMIVNRLYMRNRDIRMVQPIMGYLVTDRGIQGSGLLIKFPIEDQNVEIRCNKSRRFIEFLREQQNPLGGKMVIHQRLYMEARDLERALEAIRKYGKLDIKCPQ